MKNLVGDSLIASCTIAYLGPFTPDFRESLVKSWHKALTAFGLPHTDGCTLISTLSDPVEVRVACLCVWSHVEVALPKPSQLRAWGIAGLPSDTHSIENAIIMANSRRRPVCVDPQGQVRVCKRYHTCMLSIHHGFRAGEPVHQKPRQGYRQRHERL